MQIDDLTDSQTEAFLAVIAQAMKVAHKAKLVEVLPDGELYQEGLAAELADLHGAIGDLRNETIAAQAARRDPESPKRQGAKAHPISQHDKAFWRLFAGAS